MRSYMKLACMVAVIGLAQTLNAQTFSFNFSTASSDIGSPADNSNIQVSTAVTGIDASKQYYVSLSLNIEGTPTAFNGDYLATLIRSSDSKTVTLFNRVGSIDGGNGYSDNGMNITLRDTSPINIQTYGTQVQVPAGTQLTGTYASRNAALTQFTTGTQNGNWNLFLYDMSDGGTGKLVSSTLTFTVVPEPATIGLVSALGLLGFAAYRRNSAKAA